MKLWRAFEKIDGRWVPSDGTIRRGKRVGRIAIQRITNRQLKKEEARKWK